MKTKRVIWDELTPALSDSLIIKSAKDFMESEEEQIHTSQIMFVDVCRLMKIKNDKDFNLFITFQDKIYRIDEEGFGFSNGSTILSEIIRELTAKRINKKRNKKV